MNKSDSIKNLAKALVEFQSEVKDPKRDANNPFFKSKYVTLDTLIDTVRPILTKHGLAYFQEPVSEDGKIGCRTILVHESGEFMEGMPFYMNVTKNDPQGAGSALTYARRYSLSAMVGVAWDDDDDANVASGNVKREKTTKEKVKDIAKQVNTVIKAKNIAPNEIAQMVANNGCTKFDELSEEQAKAILAEVQSR